MMMKDEIAIKGYVSIRGYNECGELVLSIEKNNLVVTTGKSAAARLLGSYTANKSVTQFGVGTGSAAPTLADVAPLTGQVRKNVASVAYPDNSSVQFNWLIDYTEANGLTIQEMGLFCADNSLFARIVTDPIVKTSSIRLVGSWKISF
jgi:hypothetical protein